MVLQSLVLHGGSVLGHCFVINTGQSASRISIVVTANGTRDESIRADLLSTTSTGPSCYVGRPWGHAELEPCGEYA